jgi:uncharacterized tellurite resistance protein B-like protein
MGTIAQLFESGEHSSKKGLFNNLVLLARVDGKVDQSELTLLSRMAKRLALTPEQVREIIENPEEYPLIPAVNLDDRIDRYVLLIEMMIVDGKMDPKEEHLIFNYGIALGFSENEAREYEAKIKEGLSNQVARQEIVKSLMAEH